MKNSIKISLLLLGVVLALIGVLAYEKTKVSPPKAVKFKNQYVESINKDLSLIKNAWTIDEIDTLYTKIAHEINFQWKDTLISDKEHDELLDTLVKHYVSIYSNFCDNIFQQSVWNENLLKRINVDISDVYSLKDSKGSVIITKAENAQFDSSLKNVKKVIRDYYDAKAAAFVGGYNGLLSAKSKIAAAKRYKNMTPINNCTALIERLKSVQTRLEQAHYLYLARKVANYNRNHSSLYTNESLRRNINAEILEYKYNAKNVYGRISDVSLLRLN